MAQTLEIQQLIDRNRRLLGISNTYLRGKPWFSHVEEDIKALLKECKNLIVIPYALDDLNQYSLKLTKAFERLGIKNIHSIHDSPGNEIDILEEAESVFIAGGNTSRLLVNLHGLKNPDGSMVDRRLNGSKNSLISILRKKASEGIPILGSSAGLNVLCSDIRMTNDMHIAIQKTSDGKLLSRVDALSLFPSRLSINPHYLDAITLSEGERASIHSSIRDKICSIVDHQGETRYERLTQLLEMNQDRVVLALREGACVFVEGMKMTLLGTTGGVVLRYGESPKELELNADLSYLLQECSVSL